MIMISFDDILITAVLLLMGMLWIAEIVSDKVSKKRKDERR